MRERRASWKSVNSPVRMSLPIGIHLAYLARLPVESHRLCCRAAQELPEEESRAESGADAEETWLAFVVGAWCRGKRNFMPGPVNYQEQS